MTGGANPLLTEEDKRWIARAFVGFMLAGSFDLEVQLELTEIYGNIAKRLGMYKALQSVLEETSVHRENRKD